MTSQKRHVLHDLDNPGPQYFDNWHALLVHVDAQKVNGYAVDSEGGVVNFKNGKRKGIGKTWVPVV